MITLYGMPSAGGLKQLSPFVVKVEMALLYLGLEFEVEHIAPLKIRSMSPTGKVPWIRMGNSTLSESDSIITFLIAIRMWICLTASPMIKNCWGLHSRGLLRIICIG